MEQILGEVSTALLTIINSQPKNYGNLEFLTLDFSIADSEDNAIITINRLGGSDGEVSVDFSTSNGTAVDGKDYNEIKETITFLPGETSKTIKIPILNNISAMGDRAVKLLLSNPTDGAMLGSYNTSTLTIKNQPKYELLKIEFKEASRTMIPGASEALEVTAYYSDGSSKVVTGEASYSPNILVCDNQRRKSDVSRLSTKLGM